MSHFLQLFAEKLTKTPKHGSFLEKLQVLAKWTIFRSFSRNELPFATFCWKVDQNAETWLMKFSGKICKQCLISWKSTRTHRFQQNLQRFRKNYHVFAFRWTFQKKVAEIASFLEKARKIIDLAKTNNFSNKLPCFGVLVSFSAKSCKKYCRSISGTSYNYGVRDLNLLLSPLPRLR